VLLFTQKENIMSTNNINIPSFDAYVCINDNIIFDYEGFTFTAHIEYDEFTKPTDFDCYALDDPDYGEENREIVDSWEHNEWDYCGIILSATYNDIDITDHAASLWGLEDNFPGSDNSYLNEVVKELLPEALENAKAELENMRAKLAGLVA
jgi:hypothetical protein